MVGHLFLFKLSNLEYLNLAFAKTYSEKESNFVYHPYFKKRLTLELFK